MAARGYTIIFSFASLLTASCDRGATIKPAPKPSTGLHGHLLAIGGGLEDDNKPVYERFIALARAASKTQSPHILIATAASLHEEPDGRMQIIKPYCADCRFDAITRPTPTEKTVKLIDAASAIFFTGGDQKRITTRYLADGKDTPEAAAMRRLLARGGVIAGTSAGDAMMSDPMFQSGGSAEALGIPPTRMRKRAPGLSPAGLSHTSNAANGETTQPDLESPPGPRIGRGMGFEPWAILDSHFFERHRFGRLVAALEVSGTRLGIGVSENACVEVDLEAGTITGISAAESLFVDIGGIQRDGLTRRNVRVMVIKQGQTISLVDRLTTQVLKSPARPTTVEHLMIVATREDRRTAARRFFLAVEKDPMDCVRRLNLDGYDQFAWPYGTGWSVVDIEPQEIRTPDGSSGKQASER